MILSIVLFASIFIAYHLLDYIQFKKSALAIFSQNESRLYIELTIDMVYFIILNLLDNSTITIVILQCIKALFFIKISALASTIECLLVRVEDDLYSHHF